MTPNKYLLILIFFFSVFCCSQKETSFPNLPENRFLSRENSFLVNPVGDTILTGVPLTITGRKINFDEVLVRDVKSGIPKKVAIPRHINKIPKKLKVNFINIDSLKPLSSVESYVDSTIFDQIGNNALTGVPIPAKGKVVACLHPDPITALLPIFKDNATYNNKYMDEGQGMNSSRVNAITEDKRGNLWFGMHPGGVTKYDGERFTHYTSNEGLSGDIITSMLEDDNGNLWFGTWASGVSMFDGERFTNYINGEGLIDNEIRTIYKDRAGNIWIGTRKGGVCKYDGENFTHYTTREGLGSNSVNAILEDRNGYLWFGTEDRGVNRFDGKGFIRITTAEGLGSNTISTILEDRNGNLWFGTNGGGISKFDGKSLTQFTIKEGLNDNSILSMYEDESGNLWIGTEGGGINVFDGENFSYLTTDEGLSDNTITSIIEDKEGVLWFGTRDGGVNVYNRKSFLSFSSLADLNGDNVRSILEDSNQNFWFATWGGGIIKYDGEYFYQFTAEQGTGDNTIWTMLEDKQGNIWFGTHFAGLGKYDGESFTNFAELPGLSQFTIFSMLEDKNGNIWLGTDGEGVIKFDGASFIQYSADEGFSADRIWSIIEDTSGKIWFATFYGGGAAMFDGENFTFYSEAEGLASNDVWSILEDKNENLWFGTFGGGVSVFDGENFFSITTEDGLPSNIVNSITQDEEENIWLGTEKGLAQIIINQNRLLKAQDADANNLDNSLYKIVNYSKSDGLKAQDFNVHSNLLDNKNQIWLGTGKGIVIINTDEFETPKTVPSLFLSQIDINGQNVDYHNLDDSLHRIITFTGVEPFFNFPIDLKLRHDNNHLTFHFSAIDSKEQHDIEYSYKIGGLNEDWSQPSPEAKADYQNIPYGRHTFQVRVRGKYIEWSEPLEYTFTISPPWWLTSWAYAFYTIAFIISLWLFIKWQTRIHRLKLVEAQKLNHRLQQIDQLKDQFLANTSHELRTPLHGIVGIAESIFDSVRQKSAEEIQNNLGMIIASGRRLTNLINDLLDFSRAKNEDLHLQQKSIGLQAATNIVFQACQPLVGNRPIELKNEIPETLPPVLADENRLQQILFNLIGNAIKFTKEGHVKVTGNSSSEDINSQLMVTICVEDTGIGIPAEKLEAIFKSFEQVDGNTAREYGGTGLGLSITKQLVELHNGKIWVESTPGEGTRFFFTLPMADRQMMTTKSTAGELKSLKLSDTKEPAKIIDETEFSSPLAGSAQGRIRVLVVDDEPINHQVLRNYLSKSEFFITSVMSGQEAIEAINSDVQYDLILLDVMMPRISGYEVCKNIRRTYLPSELPVIMVTAKNQIKDLVEGLSVGANDYLAKPFSRDEFLARVKTQLDLYRINSVTSRFVPNEFLHSLNRERITEVALGDHTEQNVTVLFTDIRDYTSLVETMSPQDNFKLVNAFHGRMGPIIKKNDGFINQYLGDAIMAIFPTGPDGALNAGVEMQKSLANYNEERILVGRKPIRMGIGLHSGPLIMGIIGDQDRMDAATIADTVNTASRIESLTKHYGVSILLSEDSIAQLKDPSLFHFRYLGKVQVKGKKEPIGLYECFDGDASELIALKANTQKDFELGLKQFFDREFPQAVATFDKVIKANSKDKTAQIFLNKSSRYIVQGVPDDWTGVEIMTFK